MPSARSGEEHSGHTFMARPTGSWVKIGGKKAYTNRFDRACEELQGSEENLSDLVAARNKSQKHLYFRL
jgi:hypothetical protein